jgi:hypothetical protein
VYVENVILGKIAEALAEGREIGFFESLPDGSVDMSILALEEIIRKIPHQIRAR